MNTTTHSRLAIVTGGASGIGEAIAHRLAADGCHVDIWDRDAAALDTALVKLQARGAQASAQVVDIASLESVQAAAARLVARAGPPEILVNCAGIHRTGSILDCSPEHFEQTMRVNVTGTFNSCHVVAPLMAAHKRGSIVNIASWLGKTARPNVFAYCTSKFAMMGMTQSMALDLAKHGVRVNAVCPGTTADTGMRRESDAASLAKGLPPGADRVQMIPMGRMGTPAEIAGAVAYLVSDDAAYVTGQSLHVSGGLYMS